jgi:hypothetical protein
VDSRLRGNDKIYFVLIIPCLAILIDTNKEVLNPLVFIKEEIKMPYITSVERLAIKRGTLQGTINATRESVRRILKINIPDCRGGFCQGLK